MSHTENSIVVQQDFLNGLTVTEFKPIVANWPEVDGNGEPSEVWIETGRMASSMVTAVVPLNCRGDRADLMLESLAFVESGCEHTWGHSDLYDRLIYDLNTENSCIEDGQLDDSVHPYTRFIHCPECGVKLSR